MSDNCDIAVAAQYMYSTYQDLKNKINKKKYSRQVDNLILWTITPRSLSHPRVLIERFDLLPRRPYGRPHPQPRPVLNPTLRNYTFVVISQTGLAMLDRGVLVFLDTREGTW